MFFAKPLRALSCKVFHTSLEDLLYWMVKNDLSIEESKSPEKIPYVNFSFFRSFDRFFNKLFDFLFDFFDFSDKVYVIFFEWFTPRNRNDLSY